MLDNIAAALMLGGEKKNSKITIRSCLLNLR